MSTSRSLCEVKTHRPHPADELPLHWTPPAGAQWGLRSTAWKRLEPLLPDVGRPSCGPINSPTLCSGCACPHRAHAINLSFTEEAWHGVVRRVVLGGSSCSLESSWSEATRVLRVLVVSAQESAPKCRLQSLACLTGTASQGMKWCPQCTRES